MFYTSQIALEELDNHTVCVRTEDGVRRIQSLHDLHNPLVFVDQVIPKGEVNKITAGKLARCLIISINL